MTREQLQDGQAIRITNPAYKEFAGRKGTLRIDDIDGVDCWHIEFPDGTGLGVGEDDVEAVR